MPYRDRSKRLEFLRAYRQSQAGKESKRRTQQREIERRAMKPAQFDPAPLAQAIAHWRT